MIPLRDARPPSRTPVVTLSLIAVCCAFFLWELVTEVQGGQAALEDLVRTYGATPADLVAWITGAPAPSDANSAQPLLGLFTSMFLHGGWLHLLGNMLYLWIFGNNVEDRLGRLWYPLLYVVGGVAAVAAHTLVEPTSTLPLVGASGAISAVLGAYLVLFPRARIQSLVFLGFFYQLIAVPAVIVLVFWFVLQLIDGIAALGVSAASGGVAVWAHIGGFVVGAVLALPFRLRRSVE